jgi:iron complex transport system substrate-binding protein
MNGDGVRARLQVAVVMTAAAITVAGCGADDRSAPGSDGFPTTVQNCGRPVEIATKPERVVALGPSEVTTLYAAGAAPRIVGRDDAGLKSVSYPPEMAAAVAGAPQLGTGGELTRENVIAMQPDLVVGSVSQTVTPDTLGAVDIPMISLRGNCGSNHAPGAGDGTADFDDVYSDVDTLGRLLGTPDRATAAVADMRRRVAAARPPAALAGASAAAVIVHDNALEIYGRRSMTHTQFDALGLRDVFTDADSRVFDAGIEELIARNPAVVVLLSYGQTDQQAKEQFLSLPGAATLAAVRDDAVFVQPYEYSSQGALAVTGLENMAHHLR